MLMLHESCVQQEVPGVAALKDAALLNDFDKAMVVMLEVLLRLCLV